MTCLFILPHIDDLILWPVLLSVQTVSYVSNNPVTERGGIRTRDQCFPLGPLQLYLDLVFNIHGLVMIMKTIWRICVRFWRNVDFANSTAGRDEVALDEDVNSENLAL